MRGASSELSPSHDVKKSPAAQTIVLICADCAGLCLIVPVCAGLCRLVRFLCCVTLPVFLRANNSLLTPFGNEKRGHWFQNPPFPPEKYCLGRRAFLMVTCSTCQESLAKIRPHQQQRHHTSWCPSFEDYGSDHNIRGKNVNQGIAARIYNADHDNTIMTYRVIVIAFVRRAAK